MEEEWRPVKGYEGLYEVSNTGKIRSFQRGKARILSPYKKSQGYLQIVLRKDKVVKPLYVHRLVASAFIPNPNNKLEVNHIDGNKANNNINNLEWATRKENASHAVKMGLYNKNAKKHSCPVIVFDMDGNFVGKFPSQTIVGKCLGIGNSHISEALREKSGIVCGYRFERINQPVSLSIPTNIYNDKLIFLGQAPSVSAAARFAKISPKTVAKCCREKVFSKDYTFRFVDDDEISSKEEV